MRKRLHKQARVNTCAVASLRTVLDVQLGIKVPEAALEAHGTSVSSPIQAEGTSTSQLRAMVKGVNRTHNDGRKPWRFRCVVHGTVEALARELQAGRIPMTRMYENADYADYHMIVVLAVDDQHVKLFDPNPDGPAEPTWLTHDAFVAWWAGDGVTSWYAVLNAD